MSAPQSSEQEAWVLTEVLTLSDPALIAFVDFVRLNNPALTRDPRIIRRVFAAYCLSDDPARPTAPKENR